MEVFKNNHLQVYEKEYWRLSGYERIIMEDHENCLFHKREISYNKLSTCKKKWDIFCKKKVLVKADIPAFISTETVRRVLLKTDLKWTFRGKESFAKIT